MGGRDVDDGEIWVDLSGLPRDFPAVYPAKQFDVGDERAVLGLPTLEQGHRLFARCCDGRLETAMGERVFNDLLYRLVVFYNENYKLVVQCHNSPTARPKYITPKPEFRSSRNVQK